MLAFRSYLRFFFAALLLLLGGCATVPPPQPAPPVIPPATPAPAKKERSYWKGEGMSGAPSITISLGEQLAYFYKGGKLAGVAEISSGRKGFDTPVGSFSVIQKDKGHASNLYGDYVNASGEVVKHNVDVSKDPAPAGATFKGAKMPFFMRFHEGAGMHAGRLPGHRASHGCVRLPRFMAEHFFNNAEIGTPVRVKE